MNKIIHWFLFVLGVVLWLVALWETSLLLFTRYGPYGFAAFVGSVWFTQRMAWHLERINNPDSTFVGRI